MGMRRRGAALAAVALVLLARQAPADRDHDRVRGALQRGDVLPLAEILARVGRDCPGEVLEVELEDEEGRVAYELKVLAPGGAVGKVLYDARSGALLRSRGCGGGDAARRPGGE